MDIPIFILSIITSAFFIENFFLQRQCKQNREKQEQNEVEKRLTQLSIERLKIKNDIDRIPLDELVNRKRDSENDGDNT
jgi:Flp pilus assembly protein TadB